MDDQTAGGAGGPEPPPEPPRADPIAGELVTETLDHDGGRRVTVYVPPDPPEAVVFAGDGQGISQWGGFLEAADVPSTMIVGVHGLADETLRLEEYSPVFDAERFAAHERFFRRGRRPMGAIAVRSRAGRRTHRGVWCLGGWRARARPWASAPGRLRSGLLRLAGRGLQADWRDAELGPADGGVGVWTIERSTGP